MKRLMDYFLSSYASESFMIQQQSRIFFVFIAVATPLILAVTVIMNARSPEEFISSRNLMRFCLLVMCAAALFLIRGGRYRAASNLAVYGCTAVMGLQLMFTEFVSTADLASRVILLFIFVIIAAVFTARKTVVLVALINLAVAAVTVLRSGIAVQDRFPILFYFSLTIVFITVLSFLFLTIVKATIRRIEESLKKEKKHDVAKRLLLEGKDLSQNLAELSESLQDENRSLASRTVRQASAIQEITATIEEARTAIRNNAESTGKARDLARSTREIAEEGAAMVKDVAAAMGNIRDSGERISGIITIMNEISFQTNLLALNAAVEAAHAGERGRGFAVVAGEVKNLAMRSAESAREIKDLIGQSIEKIGHGTALVTRSGDVIQDVSRSIGSVSDLIEGIAERSAEQRRGIDEINSMLRNIESATVENTGMAEKTSAIGEDLAVRARELLVMLRHADA